MTIKERYTWIKKATEDLDFRAVFNSLCKRSFRFFCNTCLWIYEPRADDTFSEMPLIPRKFQEELCDELQAHIDNNESLLIDKTREMGATWFVEAAGAWCWIFKRRCTFLQGSITEDKIDSKNNPNCLFWKFDFLVESLKTDVPWLYPASYNPKKHATHMKRFNPETQAQALGEPMGPNFGRSGRAKWIFLDEFAEAMFPASTWQACSRTSDCRILVFTPKGMNFAGQLANPPKGTPRTIDRISLHWLIDETKNFFYVCLPDGREVAQGHGVAPKHIWDKYPNALPPVYPWYEEAKAILKYDPVSIGQEIDINYNESLEGRMYPQIERSRVLKVKYDPALPLYCSMDYGVSDMTALVWFQYSRKEKRFKFISAYQNHGKSIRWYIPFITGKDVELGEPEGGYSDFDMEVIRRHRAFQGRYTAFFGDPAGKQRSGTDARSVIQVLGQYHIKVKTNDKARGYEARWQYTAAGLPFCDFDEDSCTDLVQSIRDSRLRETTGKPIHGPESHYRSAIEYGFVNQPHDVEEMRRQFAEELKAALRARSAHAPAHGLNPATGYEEYTALQASLVKRGEDYDTFNRSLDDIEVLPPTKGYIVNEYGIPIPLQIGNISRNIISEEERKQILDHAETLRRYDTSDPRLVMKAKKALALDMERRSEILKKKYYNTEDKGFGRRLQKVAWSKKR